MHNLKEDASACMDLLKSQANIKSGLGSSGRIMIQPLRASRVEWHMYAHGIAIVDHGDLGAWHVSSATAPPTTVALLGQRLLDFGGCPWVSREMQARTAPVAEKCRNQNLTGVADTKTENAQTPPSTPPPDSNGNTLFVAVTNLEAYPTALHAALPPRAALLFFLGHGYPTTIPSARRAEYQLSQN
ncbi:hypothetical protein EDB86DRAFT_3075631 [Lactarius hatsudake]|nr:hypothetical protein EDB86DRAFT_3075631 [Lactarius hatsudake]